jgi:hypothetical protein
MTNRSGLPSYTISTNGNTNVEVNEEQFKLLSIKTVELKRIMIFGQIKISLDNS